MKKRKKAKAERYISEQGSDYKNPQGDEPEDITANILEDTGVDKPANYFSDDNNNEEI